jgi:hypothetical protein
LLRSLLGFFTLGCGFLWGSLGSRGRFALSLGVNGSGLSFTFFLLLFLDSSLKLFVAGASDKALRLDFLILLGLEELLHSPVVKVAESRFVSDRNQSGPIGRKRLDQRINDNSRHLRVWWHHLKGEITAGLIVELEHYFTVFSLG